MKFKLILIKNDSVRVSSLWLKNILTFILRRFHEELNLNQKKIIHKELICVFVPPRSMRSLNHKFRGYNSVTDVLSFPSPDGWGELVFCYEQIVKQACYLGHSWRDELAYLFIHGFLHLLGYDHEKKNVRLKKCLNYKIAFF